MSRNSLHFCPESLHVCCRYLSWRTSWVFGFFDFMWLKRNRAALWGSSSEKKNISSVKWAFWRLTYRSIRGITAACWTGVRQHRFWITILITVLFPTFFFFFFVIVFKKTKLFWISELTQRTSCMQPFHVWFYFITFWNKSKQGVGNTQHTGRRSADLHTVNISHH